MGDGAHLGGHRETQSWRVRQTAVGRDRPYKVAASDLRAKRDTSLKPSVRQGAAEHTAGTWCTRGAGGGWSELRSLVSLPCDVIDHACDSFRDALAERHEGSQHRLEQRHPFQLARENFPNESQLESGYAT